ncbi:hypothetical protein QYE76_054480 [Lolium multiflorum]|uniref:CCHC-type domain-containing protein n=2 Tax=Lolium TaxID=4520 RepID=A0AAD8SZ80_LOLMU|nr:hypothetical protein QYE76_054480 [Lolium multiflorum]
MGIAKEEDPEGIKNHQDAVDVMEMKVAKFSRGKAANLANLRDKKLKGQLTGKEKLIGRSAKAAAQTEKWFLPIEGGYLEPEGFEKTYRYNQQSIVQEVDISSSKKPFDMILPVLGPYTLEYTSNGRYMIVGGRKGHIAMMDMLNMDLIKEFQVRETVHDVAFLHNEQLFAVAQKNSSKNIVETATNVSNIAGMLNGIEQLNGSNYVTWKEKLEITMALLNIDYALLNDPPEVPKENNENYEALKKEYDIIKAKWDDSNRKCLMMIKGSITQSMRGALPDCETAKGYFAKIEHQFKGSSKVYATSLIRRLIDEKYDPTGSLREHIMKKCNMAAKLKSMEMEISNGFLVHFIMSSLPPQFDPFMINYNAMDVKWEIDEMMARCVQEEERLKADRIDHVNQFGHSQKKKYRKFVNEYVKPKPYKFKEKGQSSKGSQQKKPEKAPNAEGNNSNACHFCGKGGHRRKDCFGFKRWLKERGIQYEEDPKKRGKNN